MACCGGRPSANKGSSRVIRRKNVTNVKSKEKDVEEKQDKNIKN